MSERKNEVPKLISIINIKAADNKTGNEMIKPVFMEVEGDRNKKGYWKGFWNDADRKTMRYDILGFEPDEGQWKWKETKAKEAVGNYVAYLKYVEEVDSTCSLEEYWENTGKSQKYIRRTNSRNGKNKGIEHWIPPSDTKLRSTNWIDILALKAISIFSNSLDIIFLSSLSKQ